MGWAMLRNHGWSEGEGLCTTNSGRSGNDARDGRTKKEQKARKRSRLDRCPSSSSPSPSQEQPEATEERVLVGGDDDDDDADAISEVRKHVHVPIIDPRQSNTEKNYEGEDERAIT